jgi:secondary thiamine-phosphate synthase enzyme
VRQFHHCFSVSTRGKGLYECTSQVIGWLRSLNVADGLLTVFIRHTSASLLIQENADADVLHDLEQFFRRLAPEDNRLYRHTIEGADDMPAHIRAALTQTHLAIPVLQGKPVLGVWQGIYVYEHRTAPHQRNLNLHFIGE